MALTSTQYESIRQEYANRRINSQKLLDERTREIYEKLPEYKELDELTATLSVQHGKRVIMGESDTLDELKDILEDLNRQKKLILTSAGFSVNYLDPVYTCPYCKDTGYIENEKCHCHKQAILDILYEQSNIRQTLLDVSFDDIELDYQTGDDLKRLENAAEKAKEFVKNFKLDYQNLMFYGTVGTGKSFLSNCIAHELIEQKYFVLYFSSNNFFNLASET